MNTNIATNLELVKSKISRTASSRNEMISSLRNLRNVINAANDWQGVDATAHKEALLDFCQKLENCANWMEAAGEQTIEHATKLHDRAVEDSQTANIFD